MLKLFALLLLLIAALVSWVYFQFASTKNVKTIDLQKARCFGDEVLSDFIHDRREVIYAKMSKDAQSRFTREKIDVLINHLCNQVGKIIKFEFVSDVGKVSALSKIPSRDITYEVTTDQGKTYPFTLVLVPNGSELAIQEFHFSLS